METTSRMKDFYDIYYLAKNFNFEGRKLQSAIFKTLSYRGTPYEKDSVQILKRLETEEIFINRWNNFCDKILKQNIDFETVINLIISFISPPFSAIVNETEFFKEWDSERESYKEIC